MKQRLIASVAVGAAVVLGTSGCALISPQATTIPYSPADGVNIPDSGPLKVRNALIVSEDGEEGNFVAAIVNESDEAQTLSIELDETGTTKTVRVPANATLSLGAPDEETPPLLLEDIDGIPGSTIPIYFQSGDAEGVLFQVPVLDGTLDYLTDLVP